MSANAFAFASFLQIRFIDAWPTLSLGSNFVVITGTFSKNQLGFKATALKDSKKLKAEGLQSDEGRH